MKLQISAYLKDPQTNWKYISILMILALIIGGGILGYIKYYEKETISPKEVIKIKKEQGTTGKEWSLYRVPEWMPREYWFEIRFPKDWTVVEASFPPVLGFVDESRSLPQAYVFISVEIRFPQRTDFSPYEFLEKPKETFIKEKKVYYQDISHYNNETKVSSRTRTYLLFDPDTLRIALISLEMQTKTKRIITDEEFRNDLNILEKMLPTFRFLK
jgi:hypothetical protein